MAKIELGTVLRARYFPEKFPIGERIAPLGANALENVIELRRLNDRAVELEDVALTSDPGLEIQFSADSVLNRISTDPLTTGDLYPFRFFARNFQDVTVFNVTAAPIAVVRVDAGIWVMRPTTSDKLLHDIPLTDEDRRLVSETGVDASVEKGVLPLPRDFVLQRQYHVLHKTVHTVDDAGVPAAPTRAAILTLQPRPDEFLVLEQFHSANTVGGIELIISRDEDDELITFDTLGMLVDPEVWIPATRELRISVRAPAPIGAADFWFLVGTYKLNNILRVRWDLPVAPDAISQETRDRVRAGVV